MVKTRRKVATSPGSGPDGWPHIFSVSVRIYCRIEGACELEYHKGEGDCYDRALVG